MAKKVYDHRSGANDCPLCGHVHFGVETYAKWLRLYPAGARKGVDEQRARWQAIVARHEEAGTRGGEYDLAH